MVLFFVFSTFMVDMMAFEVGRRVGRGLVVLKWAFFASLKQLGVVGVRGGIYRLVCGRCWKMNSYLRDDDLMNLVP